MTPCAQGATMSGSIPAESPAHGRIVAVRADGPGSATPMRLMAVESGWSVRPGSAA